MQFGEIIKGNAGTITLSPYGKEITTGGLILHNDILISSAIFEVYSQEKVDHFSVIIPTKDVVLSNKDGQTMIVSNFTSNATNGSSNFVDNKGILLVGATLHISENQSLGLYSSTESFPVTVNYN